MNNNNNNANKDYLKVVESIPKTGGRDNSMPLDEKGKFLKKVNPEWIPDILAMIADPSNDYNKVLKLIKEKYKISLTKATLSTMVKDARAERAQAAQSALSEYIPKYVLQDLELLQTLKLELIQDRKRLRAEKNYKLANECADRIAKLATQSLELSGANTKKNIDEGESAKSDLIDALAKATGSK